MKLLSFSNEEDGEEEEGSTLNILPTKMISAPETKNNSKKLNSKNKNIDKNDKKVENENQNEKNENEEDFDGAKYEKMLRDAKKKAAQYNFDDEDGDDDDDNDEGKTIGNGGGKEGERRWDGEGSAGDSHRSHYEDSEEARKKKILKEKGDL